MCSDVGENLVKLPIVGLKPQEAMQFGDRSGYTYINIYFYGYTYKNIYFFISGRDGTFQSVTWG